MNHIVYPLDAMHPISDVKKDSLPQLLEAIDTPVLIEFWAPWCAPCRQMNPIIYALAEDLRGHVRVLKVNIEENKKTTQAYKIKSIPTLFILDAQGNPIGAPLIGMSKTLSEEVVARLAPHVDKKVIPPFYQPLDSLPQVS